MKPTKLSSLNVPICHQVQIHYKRPLFNIEKKISSSEDTDRFLREFIDLNRIDHKEFFWVMLLTNSNQVLHISEVSVGSSNGACVNFKEVFQLAILTNASSVIVAHNHPSGNLKASLADRDLTSNLKKGLKTLDLTLLDHLIITSEGYFSFTDEGLL